MSDGHWADELCLSACDCCQHYRSSAAPPQTMGRNATEPNEGNKGGHSHFVCFVSFCCTMHGVAQEPILPHPRSVEHRRAPQKQIPISNWSARSASSSTKPTP